MEVIYLDLNVFNDIEKKEYLESDYRKQVEFLEGLIVSGKVIVPYSNAHISDLRRGYSTQTIHYIEGHLNNIARLTNNLAIVQYWGRDDVTWHYRDINEFFESSLIDPYESHSFSSMLLEHDVDGLIKLWLDLIETHRLDSSFQLLFNADPIMKLMFPTARTKMNLLAFCEDMFQWQRLISKDYSLYKAFKRFLVRSYNQLRNNPKLLLQMRKNMPGSPEHLQLPDILTEYLPENKTGNNQKYNRFTDNFYKLDLTGFKSDDKFANLIDDSIHSFYGSNCNYFITKDEKCLSKANETYYRLKLKTRAITPSEYFQMKNMG